MFLAKLYTIVLSSKHYRCSMWSSFKLVRVILLQSVVEKGFIYWDEHMIAQN